jgi:peptide/nickel transport system permease protein
MRRERAPASGVFSYYWRFLTGVLHGDLGISRLYGEPVGQLLRERSGVTIASVSLGLGLGWCVGFGLASIAVLRQRAFAELFAVGMSTIFLSIPSALLAVLCLVFRLPASYAIAAVVFPRVFSHAYQQLRESSEKPHVLTARAFGINRARVFWYQIFLPVIPPMLALGGVTITLALGASIPVEALGDYPGIGQLAWRAALARDLPLLVSITLLLTAITACASLASDVATTALARRWE